VSAKQLAGDSYIELGPNQKLDSQAIGALRVELEGRLEAWDAQGFQGKNLEWFNRNYREHIEAKKSKEANTFSNQMKQEAERRQWRTKESQEKEDWQKHLNNAEAKAKSDDKKSADAIVAACKAVKSEKIEGLIAKLSEAYKPKEPAEEKQPSHSQDSITVERHKIR
jgi:hypothetical protein